MADMQEARLAIDGRHKVTEWNAAAERLTGWSASDILGRPLGEILPQILPDLSPMQLSDALDPEGMPHRDLTLVCKSGNTLFVDIHVCAGRVPGIRKEQILITLRDVTDRRNAEIALEQSETRVAALEQRLQQIEVRTSELETRLQRTEQERSDYIGTLSHELRNPLAAIVLGITLLKSAAPGSEQAHRAVDIMQRQTAHLSRMVDEMLDVARISENRIELKKERIELVQLVQRVIQDYQSSFLAKDILLSTEFGAGPLWLDADPMRLSQAVGNLLDNASKFTAEDGRVSVAVLRDSEARQAVVTVEDTGIGIGAHVLPGVFDPLVQADTSLRRGPSGLGLGLSLVKGIVELHGGQVEAASEGPGKGARFTIRLPLAPAPERQAAAAAEPASRRSARKPDRESARQGRKKPSGLKETEKPESRLKA